MGMSANPAATAAPVNFTTGQNPSVYGQSANAYTNALAGTQAAMAGVGGMPQAQAYNYNPMMAGAQGYRPAMAGSVGYNAANAGSQGYNAATVGGTNLSPYMNPYTSQVINSSVRQLGDAQQNSLNALGASATAAKAFGGSRHGVAEGVTNAEYGKQTADMVSGLNQANFMNAQGMAQYDTGAQNAARQFGASSANNASLANQAANNAAAQYGASAQNNMFGANQAAANAAGQFRAGAANNASFANQGAANAAGSQYASAQGAASQANQNAYMSGLQQLLSGAGQMGNLSQQGFNFGQTIGNQQAAQGGLQQGMQQMLIDAAKSQYAGFTGAPQASLGLPMAAVGGGAQLNQSTTTGKQNPGLFDYLSSFAGILGGLGGR